MGYITSIMSVPKRLTAQQEKFVMFLVYGHDGYPCSQTEAAKLAGYADPKDYASDRNSNRGEGYRCEHGIRGGDEN